jgi:hypothetical protein
MARAADENRWGDVAFQPDRVAATLVRRRKMGYRPARTDETVAAMSRRPVVFVASF